MKINKINQKITSLNRLKDIIDYNNHKDDDPMSEREIQKHFWKMGWTQNDEETKMSEFRKSLSRQQRRNDKLKREFRNQDINVETIENWWKNDNLEKSIFTVKKPEVTNTFNIDYLILTQKDIVDILKSPIKEKKIFNRYLKKQILKKKLYIIMLIKLFKRTGLISRSFFVSIG